MRDLSTMFARHDVQILDNPGQVVKGFIRGRIALA
jgi:hypothetical protein